MKRKLKQQLFVSLLAVGLAVAPLPGLTGHSAAAAKAKTAQAQSNVIQVFVDGKKLVLNPQPVVQKGTTLVPMRAIFNALKASVTWEATTRTIIGAKDEMNVTMQVGSKKAVKNGKTVMLAVPVQQIKGTTMVPLRVVSEALGADVKVDAAAHAVKITSIEAKMEQLREQEEQQEQEKPQLTVRQIVDMNDEKVVMITTDAAQGSGVIIGDNRIVTNYHVVRDAASATVTLEDGTTVDVQGIVGYDEQRDLAIIQTKENLEIEPAVIAQTGMVEKGDHVVAIGSPLGLQNTVSEGIVSNITFDGAQIYQISVPIDHGSSGGGLFNDSGELIGITSSGVDDTHADLNFAVSSWDIAALLYQIKEKPPEKIAFTPAQLPESLANASTDDIKALMQKQFGEIETSQGTAKLANIEVTREPGGWVTVSAVIDPAFYMVYGNKASEDLRYWAIDTGLKLHKMLPDNVIQLVVYYDQTFNFEPRGFAPGEVTDNGDGTWRLRYPVIQMQGKDKMNVQIRS